MINVVVEVNTKHQCRLESLCLPPAPFRDFLSFDKLSQWEITIRINWSLYFYFIFFVAISPILATSLLLKGWGSLRKGRKEGKGITVLPPTRRQVFHLGGFHVTLHRLGQSKKRSSDSHFSCPSFPRCARLSRTTPGPKHPICCIWDESSLSPECIFNTYHHYCLKQRIARGGGATLQNNEHCPGRHWVHLTLGSQVKPLIFCFMDQSTSCLVSS